MFHVPNKYRIREGMMGSGDAIGNNGAFEIPEITGIIRVIASDGMGWEHVSASLNDRIPVWGEMCYIKKLFWDEEDCVVQYHPPKSEYVNYHPKCLHLWRPTDEEIPYPPAILVGPKGHTVAHEETKGE